MKKKKISLERLSKGQFSKIRHISNEVCRILRLCPQMQCLSRKLISEATSKEEASLCKGQLFLPSGK